MIKSAKGKAKKLIFTKYKCLLIPSTICMLLDAISFLFFNVIITYMYWDKFNLFFQLILLFSFIGLEFVCIPLFSVVLFKTIVCLDNTHEGCTDLSVKYLFSDIKTSKIIKADFLPRFLHFLIQACSTKMFYYNKNYLWVAIVASWINIFVSYKFFANDYFIACGDEHPIKKSFGLMKKSFLGYLLLGLSFIGYVILSAAIGILLQYLIVGYVSSKLYLPQWEVFKAFGFGVGFYLTPYIFTSKYFWIKQKIQTENEAKNHHNQ